MQFSIFNKTQKPTPRAQFEKIKDAVLGEKYELSLVFCGNALSQRLNRTYRGKDKPTNVSAFPVSKTSGEMFINLSTLKGFSVLHLFIHGLLHLKGMEHSATMEHAEQALLKKYGPNVRRRH